MKLLSAVAVCLLVVCVSGQSYDDWIKTVQEVPSDEPVTFDCTNVNEDDPMNSGHPRINEDDPTFTPWVNATPYYWLANLEKIENGSMNRAGNIVVNANASMLTVFNVTTDYFGIYHCVMLLEDGSLYLVKWGINIKGPYFKNLWDKYEMNVIIGFSAMGGFLVLAGLVMGVYHFRYIDPEEEERERIRREAEEKEEGKMNIAYLNGGYVDDYKDKLEMEEKDYSNYDDIKTPPEDEYTTEPAKNDPTVVSVAEIHSDSKPVYTINSNPTPVVSSMPEPEEDTKF